MGLHQGTARPRGRSVRPAWRFGSQHGYVALILPTHEMWRRLCMAIERPDLLDHPQCDSVIHRAENFTTVIRPEAERWTRSRSRREIVEHFADYGLPAGEAQTVDELYHCPHLDARHMFLDIDDPHAGPPHDPQAISDRHLRRATRRFGPAARRPQRRTAHTGVADDGVIR